MAHDRAGDGLAPPRKASTFQLVFMTYSVICSGAYGLEEMVSASGPGMAMLTLVVLPFIWAVPVAMSLACDGGQVVVVGSPRGKAKEVNFYDDLHRRYIEVSGAHGAGGGRVDPRPSAPPR